MLLLNSKISWVCPLFCGAAVADEDTSSRDLSLRPLSVRGCRRWRLLHYHPNYHYWVHSWIIWTDICVLGLFWDNLALCTFSVRCWQLLHYHPNYHHPHWLICILRLISVFLDYLDYQFSPLVDWLIDWFILCKSHPLSRAIGDGQGSAAFSVWRIFCFPDLA